MDTGPIHIISQRSLDSLSRHIGLGEIPTSIFRPNIVVSDFGFENENDIKKIVINDFVFNVTEVTERCDAVSILHRKLQSISDSPILDILDELNDFDGAKFGLYLRSETDFCIHINDVVEVM
ncbi:MOSC domain-containing protein [Yersinia intermedia]